MPNRRSCSADCFGAGRQSLTQSVKNSGHDTISCPKPSSQKQAHHIHSRRMTWFSQGLRTDSAVHSAGCVITHLSVPNTRRLVLKVTCRNKMRSWLNNTIFPSILGFFCEVSCTYFTATPSSEQDRYSWTKNATLLYSLQRYAKPQHPFQCWETVSCRRRWSTCKYSMKRKYHNAHYIAAVGTEVKPFK